MTNTPDSIEGVVIKNLGAPPRQRPRIDMRQVGDACHPTQVDLHRELALLRKLELGGLCSGFSAELQVEHACTQCPHGLELHRDSITEPRCTAEGCGCSHYWDSGKKTPITLLELTLVMCVPEIVTGRMISLGQHEAITPEELVKTGGPAWVRDCLVKYLTHEANEGVLLVHEPPPVPCRVEYLDGQVREVKLQSSIERPFNPHVMNFIKLDVNVTLPRNEAEGSQK